jgi:hypothetical protein
VALALLVPSDGHAQNALAPLLKTEEIDQHTAAVAPNLGASLTQVLRRNSQRLN